MTIPDKEKRKAHVKRFTSADGNNWVDVLQIDQMYVQDASVGYAGRQKIGVTLKWDDNSREYESVTVKTFNGSQQGSPIDIPIIKNMIVRNSDQKQIWNFKNDKDNTKREVKPIRVYNVDIGDADLTSSMDWEDYKVALAAGEKNNTCYVDVEYIDKFFRKNSDQLDVFTLNNKNTEDLVGGGGASDACRLDPFQMIVNVKGEEFEYIELYSRIWESRDTVDSVGAYSVDNPSRTPFTGTPATSEAQYFRAHYLYATFSMARADDNPYPLNYWFTKPVRVYNFWDKNGLSLWPSKFLTPDPGTTDPDDVLVATLSPSDLYGGGHRLSVGGGKLFPAGYPIVNLLYSDSNNLLAGGYDPDWLPVQAPYDINYPTPPGAIIPLPGPYFNTLHGEFYEGPPKLAVFGNQGDAVIKKYSFIILSNPPSDSLVPFETIRALPGSEIHIGGTPWEDAKLWGTFDVSISDVTFDGEKYKVLGYLIETVYSGPNFEVHVLCQRIKKPNP